MSSTYEMLSYSKDAEIANEAAMQTQKAWIAESKIEELQKEIQDLLDEIDAIQQGYIAMSRENIELRQRIMTLQHKVENPDKDLPSTFTNRN